MKHEDVLTLLNEPACAHNNKSKSGCAKPQLGATQGGGCFDGARNAFPIHDSYGAHARTWSGYGGCRQPLFDVANLLAAHYQEIAPYRSRYWQGTPRELETGRGGSC